MMARDLPTLPHVVIIHHGGMLRDKVPSWKSQESSSKIVMHGNYLIVVVMIFIEASQNFLKLQEPLLLLN